jgi:peroxiredoxin
MSLGDQLAARAAEGRVNLSPERRAVYDRAAVILEASGIVDRVLGEGSTSPDFELPDISGQLVRLSDLLAKGPVIVSFYRGQWCPFCSLELIALQRSLTEVDAVGASLVAISPNKPDVSLETVENLELTFPVLSDYDNKVAKQFNLVFEMTEENVELYEAMGRDIGAMNGTGKWELPIPATYVIGRDRVIRYAFVDLNHRRRAEPADAVAVAASLSG